ncbi:aldehyde dehydrogenase family protein, partial [Achromobacter xylosoxidans]
MTIEANKLSTDLYIDGAWRASTSGRRIDVYDPSTEQVIASVADATLEDAAAAVDAAARAAAGWAATPAR